MLYQLALLGLAAVPFVSANPQVTAKIAPPTGPPAGCSTDYPQLFNLAKAVNAGSKRSVEKRQQGNAVSLTIKGGYMTDPTGYVAYIASNGQFQFDKPPQAGAIFTSGFSVCQNGTIALGDTANWFQCSNGGGARNIYYKETTGLDCTKIFLEAIPASGGTAVPSQIPSYTPTASSAPASTPAPATSAPPAPVPSGATGTGSPVPPVSSPPSTPVPPPANAGAVLSFAPEMIALAIGAIGAALL